MNNIWTIFSNRHPINYLEVQRKKLLQSSRLSNHFSTLFKGGYPNPKDDSKNIPVTVIDFETSGLNPETNHIVSMGWVHIIQDVIKISSAQHFIINEPIERKQVKRNASDQVACSLHHILPEQQQMGVSIEQAMACFFDSLLSPILIAHGTTIEKRFLDKYLLSQGYPLLPILWLDTLKISKSMSHDNIYQRDVRLSALRQQHQLPDYPAHHALTDAIATAELYLIQKKKLFSPSIAPIGILYQRSL